MDMSMFPDAVTLYNKYVEENAEKWKRTVLTGVYWNDIEGGRPAENRGGLFI